MKTGNIFYFLIALLTISLGAAAQPAFFGTTYEGGEFGLGTIYKTDANGDNHEAVFGPKAGGESPSGKLLEVSSGVYFGLTSYGGPTFDGVIFEYDMTSGTYIEKYAFDDDSGSGPLGSLIKASNGKLYGLTESGGLNGDGVIFEYDYVNDVYTKKVDLEFGTTGNQPVTSFLEASNGKLYGLVTNGGVNTSGAIIEYDPVSNAVVRKADFINAVNGRIPRGRLIEHNGKLLGTTVTGGPNDGGTLFAYDLNTATLSTLIDFPFQADSQATPMIASNGKMYGVTRFSGLNNSGQLYEYDFNTSTVSYVVQFLDHGLNRGVGDLIEISSGKLVGKCEGGATHVFGGIFEYDFNTSTFAVGASFDEDSEGSYDPFTLGSDGNLYGMNPYGGTAQTGVLYKFDPSASTINNLYTFNIIEEGTNPTSLALSADGNLYGVNNKGGVYGGGTLFRMNPVTLEITPLVQFKPTISTSARVSQVANNYSSPHFIMEASNGKLYGRTNRGGAGNGVIFEYDPATDELLKKFDFDSNTGDNGGGLRGGLLEVDGKLYGVNRISGPSGDGALFEYDIASSDVTAVADFSPAGISEVTSNLVLASDGKLYGTSTVGGLNNRGTIFEYDITSETITKKIDFDAVSGANSFGGLISIAADKLMGITYAGGTNNKGEVFEYTPSTNTYTTRASFDAIGVTNPVGELLAAANGKFFGLSGRHLFGFNPTTNLIVEQHDFESNAGSRFYAHSLLEACTKPQFDEMADVRQCAGTSLSLEVNSANTDSYIWKRNGQVINGQTAAQLTIASTAGADSGTYTCELTNVCGTTIVSAVVIIDELSIATTFDGTEVSVAATGGTSPYTYSSNGTDFQPSSTFLLANGQYTITVRDANSCEASSTENLVITDVNGAVEKKAITPYPNPVKSNLSLEGLARGARVRMLDVAGRVVYDQILREANASISTEALKSGLYILETTDSKGNIERVRVLKE
ncbi:MAG: T9SS type A sorting domain-containing protein [Cytophagales bacterium]